MSHNVSGQAYALTVLTPIIDGHEAELTAHLEGLEEGDASPLARVPGTHIARWVVMDQVDLQGAGQRRHDALPPRLLFSSNFDGELDAYLEGLRTGMAEDADAIWGHCRGYPGHGDGAGLRGLDARPPARGRAVLRRLRRPDRRPGPRQRRRPPQAARLRARTPRISPRPT